MPLFFLFITKLFFPQLLPSLLFRWVNSDYYSVEPDNFGYMDLEVELQLNCLQYKEEEFKGKPGEGKIECKEHGHYVKEAGLNKGLLG